MTRTLYEQLETAGILLISDVARVFEIQHKYGCGIESAIMRFKEGV